MPNRRKFPASPLPHCFILKYVSYLKSVIKRSPFSVELTENPNLISSLQALMLPAMSASLSSAALCQGSCLMHSLDTRAGVEPPSKGSSVRRPLQAMASPNPCLPTIHQAADWKICVCQQSFFLLKKNQHIYFYLFQEWIKIPFPGVLLVLCCLQGLSCVLHLVLERQIWSGSPSTGFPAKAIKSNWFTALETISLYKTVLFEQKP